MKPKQHTYVDPDDYLGEDENERQDATVEARFADSCTNNVPVGWAAPAAISAARIGETRILLHHYCPDPGGGLNTLLDQSADWRDGYMDRSWVAKSATAATMPGGTAYAGPVGGLIELDGYTGKGAAAGAPPGLIGVGTAGVGEYWTPWAGLYIYVDGNGRLDCFNNTGADIYLWGEIGITGDIGGF